MTITSQTAKSGPYTGNGSTTSHSYGFKVLSASDLVVTLTITATGVGTVKTLTTHYTVTGIGVPAGGTIEMVTPAASSETITITRAVAQTQTADLVNRGAVSPSTIEDMLDRVVQMIQDFDEEMSRSIKSAVSDTAISVPLPLLATRASKVFSWDASGNPEATIASTHLSGLGAITSDISTVAGISANVTTVAGIASDVTAVAADATDIGAVAAKATEIGRLGTADAVADMNTLGTAAIVTDMDLLGTSGNVTAMGLLGTSANVTAMSALSASAVITDMSILGTADVVNDMNILGTADVVTDMNVLAVADVVSDMNTLATAAIVTDMNLLGTSANVTAMGLLGVSGVITDMNTLGTADIVTDMNTLATADVVTDMNTLGTADVVTDMNTLATGANVTAMATVATNIAGVNSFAERYRVASSDPVSSLDEGDLYYNTTSNVLRFYNGTTWLATVTTSSGDLVSSNNLSDVSSATTALSNLGGVGVGLTLALGG